MKRAVIVGDTPVALWGVEARGRLRRQLKQVGMALDDPGIVHFSGASKPWQSGNAHPPARALRPLPSPSGTPGSRRVNTLAERRVRTGVASHAHVAAAPCGACTASKVPTIPDVTRIGGMRRYMVVRKVW